MICPVLTQVPRPPSAACAAAVPYPGQEVTGPARGSAVTAQAKGPRYPAGSSAPPALSRPDRRLGPGRAGRHRGLGCRGRAPAGLRLALPPRPPRRAGGLGSARLGPRPPRAASPLPPRCSAEPAAARPPTPPPAHVCRGRRSVPLAAQAALPPPLPAASRLLRSGAGSSLRPTHPAAPGPLAAAPADAPAGRRRRRWPPRCPLCRAAQGGRRSRQPAAPAAPRAPPARAPGPPGGTRRPPPLTGKAEPWRAPPALPAPSRARLPPPGDRRASCGRERGVAAPQGSSAPRRGSGRVGRGRPGRGPPRSSLQLKSCFAALQTLPCAVDARVVVAPPPRPSVSSPPSVLLALRVAFVFRLLVCFVLLFCFKEVSLFEVKRGDVAKPALPT